MDYEQKYNEALERAKEIKSKILSSHLSTESCKAVSEYIDEIIPELAESEDERIRAVILKLVLGMRDEIFTSQDEIVTKEKVLAYLDKQKELPFVKDVILGYPGLYLYDGERMHFQGSPAMEEKKKKSLRDFIDDFPYSDEQEEQKPTESSDEELVRHPPIAYTYPSDASRDEQLKMALLALLNSDLIKVAGNKFTKQDLIDWVGKRQEQKPAEWNEEDKTRLTNILIMLQEYVIHHYSKDDVNKSVDWLKSLPERFNLQLKQEWSDEDKRMLSRCIKSIETSKQFADNGTFKEAKDKEIAWLKSLRPQPKVELSEDVKKTLDEVSHILIGLNYKQVAKDYKQAIEELLYSRPSWKPSEEQMTNLLRAEGRLRIEGESVLASKLAELYEQLKKLIDK